MTAQDIKRKVMERHLTLIGYKGLSNVEHTIKNVQINKVAGDFVETGCWKGGACLYARALLNELGMQDRKVYACDSFQGLPTPDVEHYPLDEGDTHYKDPDLAAPIEEVKGYFEEYGLSENTVFVEGWFKETMPMLKDTIKQIAILRLDGDMYESTIQVLENLYEKVSLGGIVIVDDYGLDRCKWAIDDFAKSRGIREELMTVDHTEMMCWQRTT